MAAYTTPQIILTRKYHSLPKASEGRDIEHKHPHQNMNRVKVKQTGPFFLDKVIDNLEKKTLKITSQNKEQT